jgi:hypothetical protein
MPALQRGKFVTADGAGYRLWRKSDENAPARR